jgi:hypothetical protein
MKNRWTIGREVGHGGKIPTGWHLAWYEPRRRVGVYFPMPLHWVARAARELIHRVRLAIDAPEIERAEIFQMQRSYREHQRIAEEYSKGYLAGWRECFHSCLQAVEEEMSRDEHEWDVRGLLPELLDMPDGRVN